MNIHSNNFKKTATLSLAASVGAIGVHAVNAGVLDQGLAALVPAADHQPPWVLIVSAVLSLAARLLPLFVKKKE